MASKTVKMLKAWLLHPVGEEFTTDESVADLLIARGAAEEVKPPEKTASKPKIEQKRSAQKQ